LTKKLFHSNYKVKRESQGSYCNLVKIPTSKSVTNRLLILGALSGGEFTVNYPSDSSDVEWLLHVFKSIGIKYELAEEKIKIFQNTIDRSKETVVRLETGDGGTTNRFVIPLLCRITGTYILKPSGRIKERPIEPLLTPLRKMGYLIEPMNGDEWLKIVGDSSICPEGNFNVDCTTSTQFATALALAFSDVDSVKIIPDNLKGSIPYWKMTENLIAQFQDNVREFTVPVDSSSLSYPLALWSILLNTDGQKGIVENAKLIDSFQADSIIIEILDKIGCSLDCSDGLWIRKNKKLISFVHDCSACPDIVMTLAFIASYCSGKTKLLNIDSLKYKECDRIEELLKLLKLFDVSHQIEQNNGQTDLIIDGGKRDSSFVKYEAPDDHRLIMVAYLFMRVNGGGEIVNANHIKKSFPDYFIEMEKIGNE